MGGRKNYSVKRVIGKGFGKLSKPLFESIKKADSQGIAVITTKIATENKKQEQQFLKTTSLIKYLISPDLKEKADTKTKQEFEKLHSKYGTESKPLTKEENKFLAFAIKQVGRRRK